MKSGDNIFSLLLLICDYSSDLSNIKNIVFMKENGAGSIVYTIPWSWQKVNLTAVNEADMKDQGYYITEDIEGVFCNIIFYNESIDVLLCRPNVKVDFFSPDGIK